MKHRLSCSKQYWRPQAFIVLFFELYVTRVRELPSTRWSVLLSCDYVVSVNSTLINLTFFKAIRVSNLFSK